MGNNKEKIIEQYFVKKLRVVDIAKELKISKSAVTQVLQKEERYSIEKELRKQQNRKKNIEFTKKYITIKRKQKETNQDYVLLKQAHDQATRELSRGRRIISNRAFRNWNTSIYKYDNKRNSYVLKRGIVVGNDVPRVINWKNY